MALLCDIGPRMGFDESDTAVLVDLVRHHLLLPDIATRRDIGDAAVVEGVAEAVGSLGTLELLAALTEADSLATGPSAWGSWKAELVAELVDRVAGVLRGEAEAPGRAEGGFPDAGVRQLLATGETVVRGSGPHLTVVAPDRTGLFSRVAGVLSLRGLTVVGADALSDARMAASRFRVDVDDGVVIDWDTVAVEVRRALEGRLALDARLSDRARRPRQAAALTLADAPRVRIDNGASAESTVVEVRAPDGPAVLYRITRALADLDLDIRLAKVATLGAEVLDTFYVRTAGGGKLHDRGHQRELERAILHRLSS
ncbi:MAG: [protein-PII] uridylyltransferase, partial [Actinomycetota bacterium]|nr:[protein-PII] uridylyltransferase [Actinomycetota bacterium]